MSDKNCNEEILIDSAERYLQGLQFDRAFHISTRNVENLEIILKYKEEDLIDRENYINKLKREIRSLQDQNIRGTNLIDSFTKDDLFGRLKNIRKIAEDLEAENTLISCQREEIENSYQDLMKEARELAQENEMLKQRNKVLKQDSQWMVEKLSRMKELTETEKNRMEQSELEYNEKEHEFEKTREENQEIVYDEQQDKIIQTVQSAQQNEQSEDLKEELVEEEKTTEIIVKKSGKPRWWKRNKKVHPEGITISKEKKSLKQRLVNSFRKFKGKFTGNKQAEA